MNGGFSSPLKILIELREEISMFPNFLAIPKKSFPICPIRYTKIDDGNCSDCSVQFQNFGLHNHLLMDIPVLAEVRCFLSLEFKIH